MQKHTPQTSDNTPVNPTTEETDTVMNTTPTDSGEKIDHQKNWRTNNPEKVAAYQKKWRTANPQAVKTAHEKYQANHPEKVALWHKRSGVKKAMRELIGSITLQGGIATEAQSEKMGKLQDQLITIDELLKIAK